MNWDFEPEMRDYEGELRRLRRTSRGYLVLVVVSGIMLAAAAMLAVIGLV